MVEVLISEIFTSLQGEAKYTGNVTTFIRLGGCPFKCSYCDQKESRAGGEQLTFDEIMAEVRRRNNKYVCITGGEPLMQYNDVLPLIYELNQFGYTVSIETSGLIPLPIDHYKRSHTFVNKFCNQLAKELKKRNLRTIIAVSDVWFDFDIQIMWTTIKADDSEYTWQLLNPTEQKEIILNNGDAPNVLKEKADYIEKHEKFKNFINSP